jgi:epoxyqueuosine reductase QueG
MKEQDVHLWGVADLRDFATPGDESGKVLPFALSWAVPMNPRIMARIQHGPNQAYADEYAGVNDRIDRLAKEISAEIRGRGFRALELAASDRTDPVHLRGDFPHKTAATRAGLGWIGRHCQLGDRFY